MRIYALLLALGIALGSASGARAHQDGTVSRLLPGAPVLDVTLQRLSGGPLELPGKAPLLVVVWSLYDGAPLEVIRKALPPLRSRHPRLALVGINLDSKVLVRDLPTKVRARSRELGWDFPQALDPLRYSRDALGLLKTPAVLLLVEGRMAGSFSFAHEQDTPLLEALVRQQLGGR